MLDGQGRRFMPDEHPDAELAPRDIVARAVWRRVAAGERVTLDMRSALAEDAGHFPTVLDLCAQAGIDPTREPVPIAPAAHITWAASSPTPTGTPASTACGPAARSRIRVSTAPTALPATRCSKRWCLATGSPARSRRRCRAGVSVLPSPSRDSGGAGQQRGSHRRASRPPPPGDVRPCRAVARCRWPGSAHWSPGRAGSGTHPACMPGRGVLRDTVAWGELRNLP